VSLENLPALELIAKYGKHPNVLLYVDPPYLGSTRVWGNQYRYELRSDPDHIELLDALRGCQASVVLSGYARARAQPCFGQALSSRSGIDGRCVDRPCAWAGVRESSFRTIIRRALHEAGIADGAVHGMGCPGAGTCHERRSVVM
jgi:hypothetical protein